MIFYFWGDGISYVDMLFCVSRILPDAFRENYQPLFLYKSIIDDTYCDRLVWVSVSTDKAGALQRHII